MLQLDELVLISHDVSNASPDKALSGLHAFSIARKSRFMLRTQKIEAGLQDWEVSIQTRGEQKFFVVCCREWPRVWPLARCMQAETSTHDDLRAWIASEDTLADLHKHLGNSDAIPCEASEMVGIEWALSNSVRAMFFTNTKRAATLTLSAAPGSRETLFEIAQEIAKALPFVIMPFPIDFSDNAACEPVKAARLKLPRDASPTDAFIEIGKSVAAHWFGNDAASRDGLEAEHVHQLRVAQRRLKTALKLFPEWIDDTWNTRIAPDLKWFGDLLAEARDSDVFADTTLPAYAEADSEHGEESWSPLKRAADANRITARKRLQDAMNSPRYASLALSFVQWFSTLETPPEVADRTLVEHARKRINKHYRKIARAPDLTAIDARTRHKVRIHAKRLRYALEFFRSIITRSTHNKVENGLGELQSVLGEGNDAEVAAHRLAAMDEAADFQKGLAKGFAVAAQQLRAAEGERILRKIKKPRMR